MYHCHVKFCLAGAPCEAFEAVRAMEPLERFTHAFTECAAPRDALASGAGVILAHLAGEPAAGDLRTLLDGKPEETQVILLAERADAAPLEPMFPELRDFWPLPMTAAEARFRFLQWQRACRGEKDLWLTRQYLETTINSVPNLVWYKDRNGLHQKVNLSFCKTVNKPRRQVEGRDHYDIWDEDPNDPETGDCMASDRKVMERGGVWTSEESVKTRGGPRLLTTYKAPLYELDGAVMGTVGGGIDITRERAYEQEIVRKNHALEAIFTSLDCGVLCHSLDGSRILNVNAAALRILGYGSKEELERDGFVMVAQSVLDEDKPALRAAIRSLKKEGDSASINYRVRHRDGELLHVIGNVKLLREDGELYYQRFLLDWTAQTLQEKENERRQAELVRALSVDYSLVCFFNLDTGTGMPLRVDDAALAGDPAFTGELDLGRCMERYIETRVFEADREALRPLLSRDSLERELAEKRLYFLNFRALEDGGPRYYELKAVRAGDWEASHGAVLGFHSVDGETRAKMEQKRLLEDALLQANRASEAKSAFLSNMSHDIRTPMNAIVGFTTLAVAHIDSREQVRAYLGKIMASSSHLLSLINDVLDMSQIESGKMRLEEAPCSLAGILYELGGIVQTGVRSRRQRLQLAAEDVVHEAVWCDRLRLNQVLLNVLSNAVKYTGSGGSVTLRVRERAGAPEGSAAYDFLVQDTGIGMSPEFLDLIFEPFEREKNTTASGVQGTGLGMVITKNLVQMMDGDIQVQSRQGAGTEVLISFTFRLDGREAPPALPPQWRGVRTMVSGGDESVLRLAERLGLRAEGAASAGEAAERGRRAAEAGDPFRLWLLDWLDQDADIAAEARDLRREIGREGAVVVLTAYDWADVEREARKAGVTAFCAKPLFASGLRDCLESVSSGGREAVPCGALQRVGGGGRILLVEDNELNQEIAVAILEDAGFQVEVAENGREAVERLESVPKGHYRVVLMDVQMPVMNGYEATRAIRALPDPDRASIPILAMTANAFEEDRQRALRSGMNGHIAKPIDVDALLDTLRRITGGSEQTP